MTKAREILPGKNTNLRPRPAPAPGPRYRTYPTNPTRPNPECMVVTTCTLLCAGCHNHTNPNPLINAQIPQ